MAATGYSASKVDVLDQKISGWRRMFQVGRLEPISWGVRYWRPRQRPFSNRQLPPRQIPSAMRAVGKLLRKLGVDRDAALPSSAMDVRYTIQGALETG